MQLVQARQDRRPVTAGSPSTGSVPDHLCAGGSTRYAGEADGPTAVARPRSLAVSDRASATRIAVGEGTAIEMERPFVPPPPLPDEDVHRRRDLSETVRHLPRR